MVAPRNECFQQHLKFGFWAFLVLNIATPIGWIVLPAYAPIAVSQQHKEKEKESVSVSSKISQPRFFEYFFRDLERRADKEAKRWRNSSFRNNTRTEQRHWLADWTKTRFDRELEEEATSDRNVFDNWVLLLWLGWSSHIPSVPARHETSRQFDFSHFLPQLLMRLLRESALYAHFLAE